MRLHPVSWPPCRAQLALTLSSLGLALSLGAQTLPPAPVYLHGPPAVDARWQASFDAFAAADRKRPPVSGGVVFVGSSSIRLWRDLETRFPDTPVIQRGFGGSRMSDVAAHADRLVLPYAPRLVVVYAGDNDLAEGRTPAQVLASFRQFVERVRAQRPDTRIAFLSIKPSPARAALLPQVEQANALVAQYCGATAHLDFIDVYTAMLDLTGRPRTELFTGDALHLNAAGYALWAATIAPYLAGSASVPARAP